MARTEAVARKWCEWKGYTFKGITENPAGIWWDDDLRSTGYTPWVKVERDACDRCHGDGLDSGSDGCPECEGAGFAEPMEAVGLEGEEG